MKKEILKLTGFTEDQLDQFYKQYPTEAAFKAAYPNFKLGGTPEAFPQIATADNFFSYGVPVPPTIHAYGGRIVYPQIQTEAQFFSPMYTNSNNAYSVGGSYTEANPQAKVYPQGPVGGSAFYAMQDGGSAMPEPENDQTFYTQKMNDFFDKLRQNAYKNMMNGIMNTEDSSADDTKQLSVGRYGGMPSFQPGGGIPNQMIYDTFDYEKKAGSAAGTGLKAYNIPSQSQRDMFYGKIPNPDGKIIDYSQRYGFDIGKELKDYPGLMQHVVDSNFNSTQDPRYLMLIAAGAISPNFSDRFDVDKSPANLDKLWNANKDLVFQQYKDDPAAFTETVGDYRKMIYQNLDKKGFDQQTFDNLKTSKQKSDYLSGLQVNDAFTKSWNPRVDKMNANAFAGMGITPASQPTVGSAPASQQVSTSNPANNGSTNTGSTNPNYQTVTTADGQTFLVGPNNQLYSPYTGNQTQNQNQNQNYNYAYNNYLGTDFMGVANFLNPNNRVSWRDWKLQGNGITPEQLDAIKSGAANVAEVTYNSRRAILPRNRIKSVNVKFKTPGSQADNQQTASSTATTPGTTTNNQATAAASTSTNSQQSSAANPGMNSSMVVPSNQSAASVNAQVAAQQAAGRSAASATPSFENLSGNLEMPAMEVMNMQGYNKWADMQRRMGQPVTPYDPSVQYDYSQSSAQAAPGTSTQTNNNQVTTQQSGPVSKITQQAPSNTNSSDPNVARKKSTRKNPVVNQAYIDAMNASQNTASPRDTMDTNTWPGNYTTPGTPTYSGDESPFRMGGPYVLPMYATGSEVPQPGQEFDLTFKTGRTKSFNPYLPSAIQWAANTIENAQGTDDAYRRMMMHPDQWAKKFGQFRGDYTMNTPAGVNFRPDQMVPVGYTGAAYGGPMMYDVADLFFLTPQMMKKTKSKR